jgi:hypothetical protein
MLKLILLERSTVAIWSQNAMFRRLSASPSSGVKVMINMKLWLKQLDYKGGNIRHNKVTGPDYENKLIYSSEDERYCLNINQDNVINIQVYIVMQEQFSCAREHLHWCQQSQHDRDCILCRRKSTHVSNVKDEA